ncbi:MAG: FtsX-like permease family protein, partial [Clostridia bacterium]
LNKWNVDHDNKIVYTDASSVLSSTMGQMIDIISYVLIAIAGISLIVSSIMIGIITYVSVIERTKEIGVLRSLGARKKDVSRVFNAETILVGLLAGVIGVAFTYLLCFPLNAILGTFVGSVITGDLAVLNPLHSLILIVISVGLTLLSGLIPSHAASKLDPVKALRSE